MMMRFGRLFPEVAARETRTMKVFQRLLEPHLRHLPIDDYSFDELYCTERGCDCRRVMINVLACHAGRHVATINHAFEPPAADDIVDEQTFLDPLNPQSPWASALLDLFVNIVLAEEDYCERLVRHYRMFKEVVEDPFHPAHAMLALPRPGAERGGGRDRTQGKKRRSARRKK